MEFTRSRREEQFVDSEEFIVKSEQGLIKKIITILFTSVMWAYTALIFLFFFTAIFNVHIPFISDVKSALKVNNNDILDLIFFSIAIFGICFLVLFLWRIYNFKRYGKLNRRVYPNPTNDEEMLSLQLIDKDVYKYLQEDKVIIFEENPVLELVGDNGKKDN